MNKFFLMAGLAFAGACSHPKPEGKRFYTAGGNVSFVLPDSTLNRGKMPLWGPDSQCARYMDASDLFHNVDTTMVMSVQVSAYPCREDSMVWHVNEVTRKREEIMVKNRNEVLIENITGNSSSRTIEADYSGMRDGKPFYSKSITILGHYREFDFWFLGPNNPRTRSAIAEAGKTIQIDPAYANGRVPTYAEFRKRR